MTRLAPTSLRGPRGVLAGLVCGVGGVWAHTAVSGHSVGLAGVLVVIASVASCLQLARHELRLPSLLAVTGVAQGLGHAAMSLSAPSGMSGMSHHGMPMEQSLAQGGLPMLGGHVLVALATAGLARGIERTVLDAVRRLVRRLLPQAPDGVVAPPWRRAAAPVPALVLTTQHVVPGLGSRGPPHRASLSPLT